MKENTIDGAVRIMQNEINKKREQFNEKKQYRNQLTEKLKVAMKYKISQKNLQEFENSR